MQQSEAELLQLIADNLPDNSPNQEIDLEKLLEVLNNFNDSLVSRDQVLPAHPFRIRVEDLDAQKRYTFTHTLDTTRFKTVIYNNYGFFVSRETYTRRAVDSSTVELTFSAGIPFGQVMQGYIYAIY